MSQGIWSDPQRDTEMLGRYHTGLAFRSGIFSAWRRSYLPFDVFRSLSHVRLFATPWTASRQASLSFTISWNLLKLMPIESVMFPPESTSLRAGSGSCLSFYPSGFY